MSQTVWSNHPDGVAILKHKIETKKSKRVNLLKYEKEILKTVYLISAGVKW